MTEDSWGGNRPVIRRISTLLIESLVFLFSFVFFFFIIWPECGRDNDVIWKTRRPLVSAQKENKTSLNFSRIFVENWTNLVDHYVAIFPSFSKKRVHLKCLFLTWFCHCQLSFQMPMSSKWSSSHSVMGLPKSRQRNRKKELFLIAKSILPTVCGSLRSSLRSSFANQADCCLALSENEWMIAGVYLQQRPKVLSGKRTKFENRKKGTNLLVWRTR